MRRFIADALQLPPLDLCSIQGARPGDKNVDLNIVSK